MQPTGSRLTTNEDRLPTHASVKMEITRHFRGSLVDEPPFNNQQLDGQDENRERGRRETAISECGQVLGRTLDLCKSTCMKIGTVPCVL